MFFYLCLRFQKKKNGSEEIFFSRISSSKIKNQFNKDNFQFICKTKIKANENEKIPSDDFGRTFCLRAYGLLSSKPKENNKTRSYDKSH